MRNDRDSGVGGRRARRWTVAATAVGATVAALGACSGDDAGGSGGTGGTGGSGREVELPTGSDDVVLRLGDGPIPTLLIAGDGKVYELASEPLSRTVVPGGAASRHGFAGQRSSAVVARDRADGYAAIAPAPAAPAPMTVRQLTDDGLQRVFERADELGLLDTPPDYADVNVTDSGSTYLELRDIDGTYEHSAYALGYDDEEVDDERQAFLDFVRDVVDLEHLAGRRNITEPEPYTPATYVVTADGGYVPSGQQWPHDLLLEEGCIDLPLDHFPDGAAGTYLYESDGDSDDQPGDDTDGDGSTTRVWVVPDLPGDDC